MTIRSQQGDGGGAHDEDPLGTVKIYGDKVTESDITVKAKVFDGIDKFEPMDDIGNPIFRDDNANNLAGTNEADILHGGRGNDTISANDGHDFVFGGGGRDTLNGGDGDDWVEGGGSNDVMIGGAGNDSLVADRGRDMMTGGAEEDVFIFKDAIRSATITDFEDGVDLIDLSRMAAVDCFGDVEITQTAGNMVELSFDNDAGGTTRVDVISASNFTLDEDDFLF